MGRVPINLKQAWIDMNSQERGNLTSQLFSKTRRLRPNRSHQDLVAEGSRALNLPSPYGARDFTIDLQDANQSSQDLHSSFTGSIKHMTASVAHKQALKMKKALNCQSTLSPFEP